MFTSAHAWEFYFLGAILALAWKYTRWIYIGMCRLKKPWKMASREWFELQTIDSKASWIATIACVWVIGTMYIKQIGLAWLFGGVFVGWRLSRQKGIRIMRMLLLFLAISSMPVKLAYNIAPPSRNFLKRIKQGQKSRLRPPCGAVFELTYCEHFSYFGPTPSFAARSDPLRAAQA
jgi:hypothetical protein